MTYDSVIQTHISVNRCRPPPRQTNTALWWPIDTSSGNSVFYSCHPGYEFSNGANYASMTCVGGTTWQGNLTVCQGKM